MRKKKINYCKRKNMNNMKRRIILLSVLMTLGFAAFLSSCKKDKESDPKNDQVATSCTCSISYGYYEYGEYYEFNNTMTFNQGDLNDYMVTTCSALEEELWKEVEEEIEEGDDMYNVKIECR